MKLYCATTNPGKLAEFRMLAARWPGLEITVEPLARLAEIAPPEETGTSFHENAVIKAEYYSRLAEGLLFAEDSGLVVEALGGAPGVHSARFAGPRATDADNNALLKRKMAGISDRRARYVSVAALAQAGRVIRTFVGEVAGVLLDQERGTGGFGYDPLFFYPPFGMTLAEVDAARKNTVSHRGIALTRMFAWLSARRGELAGAGATRSGR